MEKRAYCPICEKDTILQIRNEHRTVYIDGFNVDYTADFGYCSICNAEVYDAELSDQEVTVANQKYRELTNIITTEEVEEILEKYDLSGHNLSLLLGWSDRTIDRYKSGKMPAPEYSKRLKALISPINMYEAYEQGKQRISETIGQKLLNAVHRLLGAGDVCNASAMSVATYFISQVAKDDESDLSPLKLQKLVYYAHAWFQAIYNKPLTPAGFEAWRFGPVNRELYDTFKEHHSEALYLPESFESYRFNDETEQVLKLIWNTYGLFSARYLSELTHKEDPWKNARKGMPANASSEEQIDPNEMQLYYGKAYAQLQGVNEEKLMEYVEKLAKQ